VGLGVLAAYAARFLTQVVVASRFGAGREFDAFNVALALPTLFVLVLIGSLERVFLPVVAQARVEYGPLGTRLFVNTVVGLAIVLLASTSVLSVLLAPRLIASTAPGLDSNAYALAVNLSRILFLSLVPVGLASILTVMLHVDNRFGTPVLADLGRAIVYLAGTWLLTVRLGAVGLALSFVVAATVKALLLAKPLGPARPTSEISLSHPALVTLGRLWLPIVGMQFLAQLYPLIDRYYGSLVGEGTVSYLAYALAIADLPNAFVGYSVGIVFFPPLAQAVATNDLEKVRELMFSAFRAIVTLGIPITIWLLVVREPFVRILLERGEFSPYDALRTASVLLFYAGYTLGGMIGNVTSRVIWSFKSVYFFMFLSTANLLTYLASAGWCAEHLGAEGIALVSSVVFNLSWILQLIYIRHRLGYLGLRQRAKSIVKYSLCVLAFLAGASAFLHLSSPLLLNCPVLIKVGMLGIVGCAGYVCFFMTAVMLRVQRLTQGIRWVLSLLGRVRLAY
jgi:putative peptidoglycan lipid II flippase